MAKRPKIYAAKRQRDDAPSGLAVSQRPEIVSHHDAAPDRVASVRLARGNGVRRAADTRNRAYCSEDKLAVAIVDRKIAIGGYGRPYGWVGGR